MGTVAMLDNPLGEEISPNLQSKPSHLEAFSSCPVSCWLGEEPCPHHLPTSQLNVRTKLWEKVITPPNFGCRHHLQMNSSEGPGAGAISQPRRSRGYLAEWFKQSLLWHTGSLAWFQHSSQLCFGQQRINWSSWGKICIFTSELFSWAVNPDTQAQGRRWDPTHLAHCIQAGLLPS